jgi:hypothetical protein
MRLLLTVTLCVPLASAAVHSIHVTERSDVLGRRSFGDVGPYERIAGKVNFTIDPKLPANQIIAGIDLAPRNAEGLVEFSADFYVLKPTDPARGNGTLLFEVSNRGNKGLIGMFNGARASRDPRTEADFGDRFLMERGYTLVWLGWQFDVPDEGDALRAFLPVATGAAPGLVRSEFIPDRRTTEMNLGDRNMIGYPVADSNDPRIQFTVRDRCDSERRVIPRDQYKFGRMEAGQFVSDATRLYFPAGLEPGKIYELVYTSKDPVVVGLGAAGIRDFISHLKYGGPRAGIYVLGDQRRFLKRAIGFGTSQCGRFLRTFLYYGFNADEENRMVFDGVWAHVAGAGRGSFNHLYAQPSRDGHPHMNCMYPTDIFPFTGSAQTDPETGISDGLLLKAEAAKVAPKIFLTNSSYEYWGRNASLVHTTIDGAKDFPLESYTRAYLLAGAQHGAGSFPPQRAGQGYLNPSNPNDFRPFMRALLVAFNAWIADNREPPPSQLPLIAKDQLVTRSALNFPKIPNVAVPLRPKITWRLDFGPEFRDQGIVANEPPKAGQAFPTLLPQVDADGNEIAGLRIPYLAVPLATYTGWNLRSPGAGAPDEIYSMVGSYFPFARNRTERQKNGDPRPSIQERYSSREAYLTRVRAAASALVKQRYLLEADLIDIERRAAREWDAIMNGKSQ